MDPSFFPFFGLFLGKNKRMFGNTFFFRVSGIWLWHINCKGTSCSARNIALPLYHPLREFAPLNLGLRDLQRGIVQTYENWVDGFLECSCHRLTYIRIWVASHTWKNTLQNTMRSSHLERTNHLCMHNALGNLPVEFHWKHHEPSNFKSKLSSCHVFLVSSFWTNTRYGW